MNYLLAFMLVVHLTVAFVLTQRTPTPYDSPALRIVADEDLNNMRTIKQHIEEDFTKFKSLDEVVMFLERVTTLAQKHPKNVAFAQGDLKELHKFLSQDIITKLIRFDTDPFVSIQSSEANLQLAQRAVDEDDMASRLFGGPLRSYVELIRSQQKARSEQGNHKDGNFFTNFWCKISSCSN